MVALWIAHAPILLHVVVANQALHENTKVGSRLRCLVEETGQRDRVGSKNSENHVKRGS